MVNLKKILALVLVMAMTFTMLPVLAAAEDVAVETVAPVAETLPRRTRRRRGRRRFPCLNGYASG